MTRSQRPNELLGEEVREADPAGLALVPARTMSKVLPWTTNIEVVPEK